VGAQDAVSGRQAAGEGIRGGERGNRTRSGRNQSPPAGYKAAAPPRRGPTSAQEICQYCNADGRFMPEKTHNGHNGSTGNGDHLNRGGLEQHGIYAELYSPRDRATAILAAALLDGWLTKVIKATFVKSDKESEKLFAPDSALASFDSKTRLAHALGAIGPMAFSDLCYVRKIRNKFAHVTAIRDEKGEDVALTFDTPQIRDWCDNLKFQDLRPKNDVVRTFSKQFALPKLGRWKRRFINSFYGLHVVLLFASMASHNHVIAVDFDTVTYR